MTWQLLEERRTYRSATHEEVAVAFAMELEEALGEGYQPAALEWVSDVELTVTYEYDPKHAPRPVQHLRRDP